MPYIHYVDFGRLPDAGFDLVRSTSCRLPSPPDTPFENGVFRLKLEFSEEYPAKAPSVKFVTDVFHPNGKLQLLSQQLQQLEPV